MSALCEPWIDAADVAECCGSLVGSDIELFAESAEIASDLLFDFSGRQYPGLCTRVVRPCLSGPQCGVQLLSRGYVVNWQGEWWAGPIGRTCDCHGLSRIELPNYPVQSITQVSIDGAVVDPSEYRLDGAKFLTRLRDADGDRQTWPSCQALDLPADEEGTFEVIYVYGAEVPVSGQRAAAELACQIYMACPDSGVSASHCRLPSGAVRIVAQNLTIDLDKLRSWSAKGGWASGLPLVDAFLNAKNPNGLRRPPLIWSPDELVAEELGTAGGS